MRYDPVAFAQPAQRLAARRLRGKRMISKTGFTKAACALGLLLASVLAGLTPAAAQTSIPSSKGSSVTVTPAVLKDLAPTGKLRVSINLGNIVLAQKNPATGELGGVSVELARELGKRLNVPVDYVTFDAAGKAFDATKAGGIDVIFLAIEPVRAAEIEFTAPYVLIEGTYLVRADSRFQSNADVDQPGVKITVGRGAAYDLFLTRTLKNAELIRTGTGPEAVQKFYDEKFDAVAGVKQAVQKFAAANPGLRVIEPRFMAIEQAMGTPKGRVAGAEYLRAFIEEMKANGFVADALKRSQQDDAVVAPPAK
jgi:polar amino acid transport system substrate-binding protein